MALSVFLSVPAVDPQMGEIVFERDRFNNIGRYAHVAGQPGDKWRVQCAVRGGRYMMRHPETGVCVVVPRSALHNLH